MTVVCDMGPLQYLILIGCDHILAAMYDRVLTATVVIEKEMQAPATPVPVRTWAESPPDWLEVRDPKQVLDIPTLGKPGVRGDGDRAVISLAIEQQAAFVLMDDIKARKQVVAKAKEYGQDLEPLWMLEVLDEAAEQGLIADLPEKLLHLEQRTPFYVSEKVQLILEDMKQRDHKRKQAQEQDRKREQTNEQAPNEKTEIKHQPKLER